ncbi:hypothetical protein AT251_24035 [Enterovibrio nigricans]|uniref:Uncharacterized protein n=1 Tax=Enterovibrio nigricans DSM 22720 TaxID=1121868 RepID=A0A1T4VP75_9GAMM|nr:hypothetical protein AT251_24035 [Enterovibrio nigricans]SKA66658.1 hypothetical protein SAMN02745132_04127 [Enterovibrio nigricans DSM 22720]
MNGDFKDFLFRSENIAYKYRTNIPLRIGACAILSALNYLVTNDKTMSILMAVLADTYYSDIFGTRQMTPAEYFKNRDDKYENMKRHLMINGIFMFILYFTRLCCLNRWN